MVTLPYRLLALGGKDAVDGLLQGHCCGNVLVILAIDLPHLPLGVLQGMKDALVMDGLRKDRLDHPPIVLPQIGDDHLGVVTLSPQLQEKDLFYHKSVSFYTPPPDHFAPTFT